MRPPCCGQVVCVRSGLFSRRLCFFVEAPRVITIWTTAMMGISVGGGAVKQAGPDSVLHFLWFPLVAKDGTTEIILELSAFVSSQPPLTTPPKTTLLCLFSQGCSHAFVDMVDAFHLLHWPSSSIGLKLCHSSKCNRITITQHGTIAKSMLSNGTSPQCFGCFSLHGFGRTIMVDEALGGMSSIPDLSLIVCHVL